MAVVLVQLVDFSAGIFFCIEARLVLHTKPNVICINQCNRTLFGMNCGAEKAKETVLGQLLTI